MAAYKYYLCRNLVEAAVKAISDKIIAVKFMAGEEIRIETNEDLTTLEKALIVTAIESVQKNVGADT
jgi:hypothetical protein